ncbi:MAG TPA: hypothetical protein VND45_01910 [Thermoanaerobaculia bacterium]|jgi:hypothetical protein|nr:hypothetical protein [Thermoanaerobaculia bacterium]
MTSPETAALRQRLVRVVTRHASSATDAVAVAAAARRTLEQLTVILAPLISSAGVEALLGRSFDITRREYPPAERPDDSNRAEAPLSLVSDWLERQDPGAATDAAAAMFATFAQLLATLIGEPLTTRYLEKAWPDGFTDAQPKGKKA